MICLKNKYYSIFTVIICVLWSCDNKRHSIPNNYSFYSNSNYYFDTSVKDGHFKDSSRIPVSFFYDIDEPGFLDYQKYIFYAIYFKKLIKYDRVLVWTLVCTKQNGWLIGSSVIALKHNDSLGGHYIPKYDFFDTLKAYTLIKKQQSIDSNAAINIADHIEYFKNQAHAAPENYNSDTKIVNRLFLFSEGKYYIFDDIFLDADKMGALNNYIVDTIFHLDPVYGIDKTLIMIKTK